MPAVPQIIQAVRRWSASTRPASAQHETQDFAQLGCCLKADITVAGNNSVSVRHYLPWEQFGVSSSLLLPLHQVGKLVSWEDFQDRQAIT